MVSILHLLQLHLLSCITLHFQINVDIDKFLLIFYFDNSLQTFRGFNNRTGVSCLNKSGQGINRVLSKNLIMPSNLMLGKHYTGNNEKAI